MWCRFHPDAASVGTDYFAADGQSQASAPGSFMLLDLYKAVEYFVLIFQGNADPVVGYAE